MSMTTDGMRPVITRKTLLEKVPYTIQHILRLEKAGRFPRRQKFGDNRVGWYQDDIAAWQQGRWTPSPSPPRDRSLHAATAALEG